MLERSRGWTWSRRIGVAVFASGFLLFCSLFALLHLQNRPPSGLQVRSLAVHRATDHLAVEVHGSGFTPQTRITLSLDPGHEENFVTTIPTWGNLQDIAMADERTALLANGYRGLQVLDLRDPARPRLIGSLRTPGKPQKVTIAGQLAYVADREGGVQIVDISQPKKLRIVASVETGGLALAVALAGDRAYVANGRLGLQEIDISDPARPRLLAAAGGGPVVAVAVAGGYAFTLAGRQGLKVFAIGGGKAPQLVSTLPDAASALDIAVHDRHAWIVGRHGLHIVAIDDPRHPRLVGTTRTPSLARGIAFAERRLFLTDASRGLLVFDCSLPLPHLLGTYPLPAANGLTVAGTRAYVACGVRGLAVVDVSQPPLSRNRGVALPFGFSEVQREEDLLFGINGETLTVVEMKNRSRLVPLGSLTFPGLHLQRIAVAGQRVYLPARPFAAEESSGVLIVDISDPRRPRRLGFIPLVEIHSVTAKGDLLFVGSRGGIIRIFDVHAPEAPREMGQLAISPPLGSLLADGDLLYVTGAQSGLQVFDLSTPGPRHVGGATLPWHLRVDSLPRRMVRTGAILLVGDGRNGLLIYDVSDPHRPRLRSSVPVQGFVRQMEVGCNTVVLEDEGHGLVQIDFENPDRPQVVTTFTATNITGLALGVDRVYLVSSKEVLFLPRPIDSTSVTVRRSGHLVAIFPPLIAPGEYALHVSEGVHVRVVPAAVIVASDEAASNLTLNLEP